MVHPIYLTGKRKEFDIFTNKFTIILDEISKSVKVTQCLLFISIDDCVKITLDIDYVSSYNLTVVCVTRPRPMIRLNVFLNVKILPYI